MSIDTTSHPRNNGICLPPSISYFFLLATNISTFSTPSVKQGVFQVHLVDYATHEVPLPLFGLGHDWVCTFRGAPLPFGQA